jgi:hypothetical protein
MSDDLYLQYLQSLEVRRHSLLEALARLQQQRDLEENVKLQMQQEQAIAETLSRLRRLDEDIAQHGLREARKYRLKQSYSKALGILRDVAADNPEHPEVHQAIAELEALEQQCSKVSGLITKLSCTQHAKLREERGKVANALKQVEDSNRYGELVAKVEQMDGQASIEDFLFWWEYEYSVAGNTAANFSDSEKLGVAGRIRVGSMVLFLGSGVAGMAAQEAALANQLAQQAQYTDFVGSLSSIAEYYRLKPHLGVDELLKKMNAILPDDGHAVTFYQMLAKLPTRLVLISAAYDDLLEQAFAQAGKPFVVLTSIIQKGKHEVGHVQVRFSDDNPDTGVYPKEDISSLKLDEYSVIYKIRGTCRTRNGAELSADMLALTESDYFSFARHAEKMVPDYLAGQLLNRSLLFIGYRPRHWEDRLLATALLKKREYAKEPCFRLAMAGAEPLEDVFWQRRNVTQCGMDVQELEGYLVEGVV